MGLLRESELTFLYYLVILAEHERTLKPIRSVLQQGNQGEHEVLFGVAGGDKFVVVCITTFTLLLFDHDPLMLDIYTYTQGGCFFKFQKDNHGLYGGDECAMKAANAELRGLKVLQALEQPTLSLPLVAIVDYRGYRLLCSSILPLATDTLKYGRYCTL